MSLGRRCRSVRVGLSVFLLSVGLPQLLTNVGLRQLLELQAVKLRQE